MGRDDRPHRDGRGQSGPQSPEPRAMGRSISSCPGIRRGSSSAPAASIASGRPGPFTSRCWSLVIAPNPASSHPWPARPCPRSGRSAWTRCSSLVPDERQLQACLLAGDTVAHGSRVHARAPVSRLVDPHASRIARSVARARGLARCWRGPATGGDVTLRRALAADDFAALVPPELMWRCFWCRSSTARARSSSVTLSAIEMVDQKRPRRRRRRGRQLGSSAGEAAATRSRVSAGRPDIGREHAIAAALPNRPDRWNCSPGCSSSARVRSSAEIARDHVQIRDELDRAVMRLDQAADISAGLPRLVFWFTSG